MPKRASQAPEGATEPRMSVGSLVALSLDMLNGNFPLPNCDFRRTAMCDQDKCVQNLCITYFIKECAQNESIAKEKLSQEPGR